MRLVDGDGRGAWTSASGDELRAARVSLGALGVISAVTLRCVPAFTIHRVDEPRPLDDVLPRLDELVDAHDHWEAFVMPYTRPGAHAHLGAHRPRSPSRAGGAGRLHAGRGARERRARRCSAAPGARSRG